MLVPVGLRLPGGLVRDAGAHPAQTHCVRVHILERPPEWLLCLPEFEKCWPSPSAPWCKRTPCTVSPAASAHILVCVTTYFASEKEDPSFPNLTLMRGMCAVKNTEGHCIHSSLF